MNPVDEVRLRALRGIAAEWGRQFREFRSASADPWRLDTTGIGSPVQAGQSWLDHDRVAQLEAAQILATAGAPPEYDATRLRIGGCIQPLTSAVERVIVMEELCRGDADVFMACPGPSMSGVLVDALADLPMQRRFWTRVTARPTWTYFALTEPGYGSAAASLTTSGVPLSRPGSTAFPTRLVGEKRYIGSAARADLGVVFARSGVGRFAIDAFLIETDRPGFRATPIETLGMRGAQVCSIVLDGVQVGPEDVVGGQLPASRRGLRGSLTVLQRLRPGVAAMALGIAMMAIETAVTARDHPPPAVGRRLSELEIQAKGIRLMIARAAATVDATGRGALGSAAKAVACRFARETTGEVAALLGARGLIEYPCAYRALLDARGVALMEGTETIQLLAVFQGMNSGRPLEPDGTAIAVTAESAAGQAPITGEGHAGFDSCQVS